jgi:aldehyde dehydrogenase (NAD+)
MTDLTEIEGLKDTVAYYRANLSKFMKEIPKDLPALLFPGKIYLQPEPFGLSLIIGSWNFPFSTTLHPLINAIAAGNTAIIKPSEMAPHSSAVMKEIINMLDQRVFGCLEGGPEMAIALLEQRWDLIVFTGSPEKGKLIAAAAAKNLTPTVLELGGKNPVIVDNDVSMNNAALRITQGRFLNVGQLCISPDMALVHRSRLDEFLSEMQKTIKQFFGENPKTSPDYSRMVNEFHTKRVASMLEGHGGRVICGGEVDLKEKYISPTIILNPNKDSPVGDQEVFGPILVVYTFEDFEEVLEIINRREKPLALYYFGNNKKHFEDIKVRTSSGNVTWNDCVFHYTCCDLPFGGVGNSGTNAMFGEEGFRAMSHNKSIMEKPALNVGPLNLRYPPYTPANQKKFFSTKKMMGFNVSSMKKALNYASMFVLIGVLAYKGYLAVPIDYAMQFKNMVLSYINRN